MQLKFLIENKEPEPRLGIVSGEIREGINEISFMELNVISLVELSEEDCEDLIGKKVSLSLGDAVGGELLWSRFDGVIFECRLPDAAKIQDGYQIVTFVVRPPVWKLGFETRAKSFDGKTRVEVLEEVLIESGLRKDVDFKASYFSADIYQKLDQILQTETSNLSFLLRIMREAGINFYFCAKKDGQQEELLSISDNNIFFKESFAPEILHHSQVLGGRDLAGKDRYISLFETHICTTPSSVVSTVNLGDGVVRSFEASREVQKGVAGTYRSFCREGKEMVAKNASTVIAQAVESRRVTYSGIANHFLIRAGEKVNVKKVRTGDAKKILITNVVHRLSQNAMVALSDTLDPAYECHFSAVRGDAEFRPLPIALQKVLEGDGLLGNREVRRDLAEDWSQDGEEFVQSGGSGARSRDLFSSRMPSDQLNLFDELVRAREQSGVMIGEVTEDAKVTDGNELVCVIKNERYEKLTAKIALSWLSKQGWASWLPRVGMQVYFILIQGDGGQNEAVLIGYRPTGEIKTLDPAKTTETKKLATKTPPELGSKAEEVVVAATYAPSNRQRNALLGEDSAAEVAIIDGGDDSVAVHAKNGVHIVGDNEVHIAAAAQCHSAEMLSQQFGAVDRGVVGDQKESIGGNHEMTVMGDRTLAIQGNLSQTVKQNIEIKNEGDSIIVLQNGDATKLELKEDGKIQLCRGAKNGIIIDGTTGSFGTEKGIVLTVGDKLKVDVNGENDTITIDRDGDVIEMTSDGVTIDTSNLTINGTKIAITGSQIELSGSMVTVSGSLIKLN